MKDYREPEGLSAAVLLDRLQDHPEDMDKKDHTAFLDMAVRKPRTKKHLSAAQRLYAEGIYRKGDLQRHYTANLASAGKRVKVKAKHPIDIVIASRALTPPGRM